MERVLKVLDDKAKEVDITTLKGTALIYCSKCNKKSQLSGFLKQYMCPKCLHISCYYCEYGERPEGTYYLHSALVRATTKYEKEQKAITRMNAKQLRCSLCNNVATHNTIFIGDRDIKICMCQTHYDETLKGFGITK